MRGNDRMHIGGTVRWAIMDSGRLVVQFADQDDRRMALGLFEMFDGIADYRPDDAQIEIRIKRPAGE